MSRLTIDGYGQVELNQVAFRRDGRIEAQCKPNFTDFSQKVLENGMLLAIDNVAREVKLPVADETLPIALNYTAEHMYDERKGGLKDFYLKGTDDFYPRLGYLAVGDKFTTNCVSYDSSVYATQSAFVSALNGVAAASVTLYGGIGTDGAIAVATTAPTVGPVLKVVKKTTMPDGQLGIKFQVVKD